MTSKPFQPHAQDLVTLDNFGSEWMDTVRLEFSARADVASNTITLEQYQAISQITDEYRKQADSPFCAIARRRWIAQCRCILNANGEAASA